MRRKCDIMKPENLGMQIAYSIEHFWNETDEKCQCLIDDIELLQHNDAQLLNDWYNAIKTHYGFNTVIDSTIVMQYLYHDWNEAVTHWWLYGSVVGDMIQLYLTDLENKFDK